MTVYTTTLWHLLVLCSCRQPFSRWSKHRQTYGLFPSLSLVTKAHRG